MKEHTIHNMNGKGQKCLVWFFFAFLCIYAFTLFILYFWTFASAFKTEPEFAKDALGLPTVWHFDNIGRTFRELSVQGVNILNMSINSIILVCITVIPGLSFPVLVAYVVSKFPSRFTKVIFTVYLVQATVPVIGSGPAYISLLKTFNIINNPSTMWILNCGAGGMIFFTMVAFFNGISNTYSEAAKIDGAGNFRVFFRIILPQAKGIIVAFAISAVIGAWNDFDTAFLYFDKYPTISLGLYKFQELQTYRANRPVLFMGILFSMMPVLILFLCFSKVIMKNVSIGGLKG